MDILKCLVCVHGGKLDRTKIPCAMKGSMVNPYMIKECADYQQDEQKTVYLLMQQISNIAGMHEMSSPVEVTLKKIEERVMAIRDMVGGPDV